MNEILGYIESNVKQKKRNEIIHKTMDVFIRDGIHPITMQQIAKECDVSLRSLYYYYSNKEDLAVDIQIICMHELRVITPLEIEPGDTAYDLIEALVIEINKFVMSNQKIIKYISAFDFYFYNGYPDERYSDFLTTLENRAHMEKIVQLAETDNTVELHDESALDVFNSAFQSLFAYSQRLIYREKAMLSEKWNAKGSLDAFCKILLKGLRK